MLRELPPQSDILLPNDRAPIEPINAKTWHCRRCQKSDDGRPLTMNWTVVQSSVGPQFLGRCWVCGAKYVVMEAA